MKTADRQPRRLAELSIAFNTATLLFALPLYDKLFANPGTLELLRLILFVQVLPTAGLFLLGRLVARYARAPHWRRWFWTGCMIAAVLSVVRLAEMQIAPYESMAWQLKLIGACAVGALLVLGAFGRRAHLILFGSLAPIILIGSVYSSVQIAVFDVAINPPPAVRSAATSPRNDSVYIIIFDELGRDVLLKDGEIDGQKFPHFKALAAESVRFTNATTNYGATCHAIPSMLTGRFVVERGRGADEDCKKFFLTSGDENLLLRLAQRYKVSVYEEYFRDCKNPAPYTCRGIPYLVATYPYLTVAAHLVPNSMRKGVIADWLGDSLHTYTWALFREFLAGITAAEARGRAYYLHLLLPHFPYAYDARGARYDSPYQRFEGEPEHDALAYANYQQQVMLVDRLLGQFVAKLKAEGLYDEATIVITSDHGPLARMRLDGDGALAGVSRQIANVPLLIRSPRLQSGVTDVDYQHVDFSPTFLDVLGLPPLAEMDGVSAFNAQRPAREKRFMRSNVTYVLDRATSRWMARQDGGATPQGTADRPAPR